MWYVVYTGIPVTVLYTCIILYYNYTVYYLLYCTVHGTETCAKGLVFKVLILIEVRDKLAQLHVCT